MSATGRNDVAQHNEVTPSLITPNRTVPGDLVAWFVLAGGEASSRREHEESKNEWKMEGGSHLMSGLTHVFTCGG